MAFAKVCKRCREPFASRESKIQYCSAKCSYASYSETAAKRREQTLEEARRKAAEEIANAPPPPPPPKKPKPREAPEKIVAKRLPGKKSAIAPHVHDHDPSVLGRRILVIPDTQVKPGINQDHLEWVGKYIAEKRPDYIVHLGDHWDMPSLSSYDKGKKCFEGRRYVDDIEAGNAAMKLLTSQYRGVYTPEEHFLLGNHEDRITRATENSAELTGIIGLHHLDLGGWNVHSYMEVIELEGVKFSHFFTSGPMNRPVSSAAVMLRIAQGSAVQGHVQKMDLAVHEKTGKIALMAGICYRHVEEYLGPQGNNCRQQVVMLNETRDGIFDPMFVSLRYLSLKYGNV
jgi:Calcineurin-like phosphoesterase